MELPKEIIIRYNGKDSYEVVYRLLRWDLSSSTKKHEWAYYNGIKKKSLLRADTQEELLKAIKRLCEVWEDKEKIFFPIQVSRGKGKKKLSYLYDAVTMLKEIEKMNKNNVV